LMISHVFATPSKKSTRAWEGARIRLGSFSQMGFQSMEIGLLFPPPNQLFRILFIIFEEEYNLSIKARPLPARIRPFVRRECESKLMKIVSH
jgi:hypothetical protein